MGITVMESPMGVNVGLTQDDMSGVRRAELRAMMGGKR